MFCVQIYRCKSACAVSGLLRYAVCLSSFDIVLLVLNSFLSAFLSLNYFSLLLFDRQIGRKQDIDLSVFERGMTFALKTFIQAFLQMVKDMFHAAFI